MKFQLIFFLCILCFHSSAFQYLSLDKIKSKNSIIKSIALPLGIEFSTWDKSSVIKEIKEREKNQYHIKSSFEANHSKQLKNNKKALSETKSAPKKENLSMVKTLKNKRSTANENLFKDWRLIPFFSMSNNSIYESKSSPAMLLSLQKEEGIPFSKRKDIDAFFKKTEEEKSIILAFSNFTNLKTSFNRAENKDEISLFHTKGSYLNIRKQKVYYEDRRFYTNEISVFILASLDKPLEMEELKSIENFIQKWLEISSPFSTKEKEAIIAFIQNQDLK